MQYRLLGNTDLKVSEICLGTMTWGEQNTEQEAFDQLDMATQNGINFIDTAEMYPVPPRAETQGRTETYLGNWLKKSGKRDELVIATKVAGPAKKLMVDHIRPNNKLNKINIESALNDSLKRLQTDYVDLYQIHWPERMTNYFGALGYQHINNDESTPIEETLQVLNDLVKQGKIRHIGLSNETPWGVNQFITLAEKNNLTRVVSIQNPYNLLNRTFEVGLAEIAIREQVGLLAYSPLAFGVLSGKYLNGAKPQGARLTKWDRFDRYSNVNATLATQAYVNLALKNGLDPSQMALAFINQQPFVTSNIIGATNLDQLKTDIDSTKVTLSPEILRAIEQIHQQYPNPSP